MAARTPVTGHNILARMQYEFPEVADIQLLQKLVDSGIRTMHTVHTLNVLRLRDLGFTSQEIKLLRASFPRRRGRR